MAGWLDLSKCLPCFCPFLKNGSLRQSTEVKPRSFRDYRNVPWEA